MAKKLESPTSLTEFAPLSPESKTESFSFRNLFKKAKDSLFSEKEPGLTSGSQHVSKTPEQCLIPPSGLLDLHSKTESLSLHPCYEDEKSPEYLNLEQKRSMTSVLRRIMNIVDKKNETVYLYCAADVYWCTNVKQDMQAQAYEYTKNATMKFNKYRVDPQYKDSDFKQYWMPDSNCKECYECGDKFTTFRRRHHCRVCGQIFCRRCCNQVIPGNTIGHSGDLRVCTYCFKTVLSCVQSLEGSSEIPADLQAFHDNIQQKLDSLKSHSENPTNFQQCVKLPSRRKSSVMGFREEDIAKAKISSRSVLDVCSNVEYGGSASLDSEGLGKNSTSLRDLYNQLVHPVSGIRYKSQEQILTTYVKCLYGCDIVDWLISHRKITSREDAVKIGQALLDAKFLECLNPQYQEFIDGNMKYKPQENQIFENPGIPQISSHANEIQESMEPLWVKEIQPIDSNALEDGTKRFLLTPEEKSPSHTERGMSSSTSMFYLNLDLKESKVSVSKPNIRISENISDYSTTSSVHHFNDENNAVADNTAAVDMHQYSNEGMQETLTENLLKAFSADYENTSAEQVSSPQEWRDSQLREDNGEKAAFEKLNSSYQTHERKLLLQLLSTEGLSLNWCDITLPIVHSVIDAVHPDVKHDSDDMDIRQYVQFKKIPGGSKSECTIVSGVVFSKTVAHRRMDQYIIQPTILLLSSSISYQRVENKLSSLEPVIMQEFEYLKNTIGKLTLCKPDILLVEKSVSRLAQEMLLDLGITVAYNTKPSVMERVSRCTQAAILSTIDAHFGRPQLGTCHCFKVKTFSLPGGKLKTLMYFDGCPTNLGCTILLRGGSSNELRKVKQIVQFMVYATYNWKLERSFLMDEYAFPPSSPVIQHIEMTCENGKQKDKENATLGLKFKENVGDDDEKSLTVVSSCFQDDSCDNNSDNSKINTGKNKQRFDDHNKKLESKCVDDFSDPLHSYLRSENDVVVCNEDIFRVTCLPASTTFRKLLDDIILCCSLNIKEGIPYLESEVGKNCQLRKYFPTEIYWSEHFLKDNLPSLSSIHKDYTDENAEQLHNSGNIGIIPSHKFISCKFTDVWNKSLYILSLLSDYRACGGTIKCFCPHERAHKEKEKKSSLEFNYGNKEQSSKAIEIHTNASVCWEKKVDALDPLNHQTLAVLFCSYSCTSHNAPNYCVNPWVVKMDFYGRNDITLGDFLERYCFRSAYVCPSQTCETPMTDHVRKFVHGSGCVHILLHELSTSVQASGNNILMWSWCQKCKEVKRMEKFMSYYPGYMCEGTMWCYIVFSVLWKLCRFCNSWLQATPLVSMSLDTWSFSFAKYLELRFYASSYVRRGIDETCTHSLHHEHYQYFAHKQIVATFKYTPIVMWEVALPSLIIAVYDEAIPVSSIVEQIKYIAIKGYGIYSTVLEKLFVLQEECCGTSFEESVSNLISLQKTETSGFREKIEQVQLRLTSPTLEVMQMNANQNVLGNENKDVCNLMWKISDQVTLLKYHIAEAVQLWNTRIQDLVSARKKEEKLSPKLTIQPFKNLEPVASNMPLNLVSDDQSVDSSFSMEILIDSIKDIECPSKTALKKSETHLCHDVTPLCTNIKDSKVFDCKKRLLQMSKHKMESSAWTNRSVSWESISDNIQNPTSIDHIPRLVKAHSEPFHIGYALKEPDTGNFGEEDKCSYSSSESSFTYGVSPGIYAGLMVSEPPYNESYVVCHKERYQPHHSAASLPKGHERSKSEGDEILTEQCLRADQDRHGEEGAKRERKERTVKTLLSHFLSSNDVSPIQYPFPLSEHAFLPRSEKIPVIVYDDELSSIIAYVLASSEYEQQLQELKINFSAPINITQRDSQSSSPSFKRRQISKQLSEPLSVTECSLNGIEESPLDFIDMTLASSQETEKVTVKSSNKMSNFHLEIQFNDSHARFYCRVYFAEQFRKLRCLVFGESEERYIRSLSRCIPWIARGGKSGSTFCKTHDDRFILKQMPKLELQSFLDLAPSYFQYLNKACLEQKPTLLAKIVGVYRIGCKNTATNAAIKMDLLVMENLFYGCNISQKYDLKGSVRNRLVSTSGVQEEDIVLLDENFLKITCDCPLYVRPHSKTVLTLAISNDTQFLANQTVMDYSLLVGLNQERKELVVGIIDYIRTFTWGKRVEMIVKSSGILGGHGKMPTIVSPELYRERFCEAMDGYFLWVPDRWTGLGKGVEC